MGNMYIFTMIDLLTGWPKAVGIPDKKADTVGLTFQRVFCPDIHFHYKYSQTGAVNGSPVFFKIS